MATRAVWHYLRDLAKPRRIETLRPASPPLPRQTSGEGVRHRCRELPEFAYGPIPEGYASVAQLKKRYGPLEHQIAGQPVAAYWRQPKTHRWWPLYRPPVSAQASASTGL